MKEIVTGAEPFKQMSMRKPSYEEFSDTLLQWFNQKGTEGIRSVSGPMCTHKAKICHEALGLEGKFTISSNLYHMGIRYLNSCIIGMPAGLNSGV